jgi:hypothetical protein
LSITWQVSNGDIVLDGAGRLVEVQGIEKCTQDLLEALLNQYDAQDPDWYNGSELHRLDSMVVPLDSIGVDTLIEQYARTATQRLMEQQENDPYVDEDELIAEIQTLVAQPLGNLTWSFFERVLTDSQLPATVGFDLETNQQLPSNFQVSQPGVFNPGGGTFK